MDSQLSMENMDCMRDKFVKGELLNDRYRTVAPLNHGSFGMVFLAEDIVTGDQVAIKCMTKTASGDSYPLAVDERSEELECHTRLGHHPNIVNLLNSFETECHIFLVLEYCSMGDLYEAIRSNRGPLETEHVRALMLQLVSAVEYMHSKGLYHRDIKPENIFLTHDGSMKLGDFGLATRSPWSYEACVGSDRYMAPEQYDPTPTGYSTEQADIWSVGICLLNILFARNPFVTPTDSDIFFADYTRDRQSLFDIFHNMSQDTFEILSNAMALDPKKRSLSGVRESILRAVCFTTDDEVLDDFCTEDREIVPANADREPLRTPSITSPHINQGDSFPWAKALQASPPQPIRQLSIIPDTESYSEDLFPASEEEAMSWYSVQSGSPSISALGSTFGTSFKSMTIRPAEKRFAVHSDPVPISGSLPTRAGRPIPAMSMIFGKGNNEMSKSWSDLWDEEEEESENETIKQRKEQNARSWSQDSQMEKTTPRPTGLSEAQSSSFANSRSGTPNDNHNKSVAIPTPRKPNKDLMENHIPGSNFSSPKHFPKQSAMDKWAALGNRRRKYHPKQDDTPRLRKQKQLSKSWRKDAGFGTPGFEDRHVDQHFLDIDWRRDPFETIKPKKASIVVVPCDRVDDEFDWIGGWHDLHI
ncbi:serine/threonine protein kinase ksp1 [Histoplasma capsulatum var. duboisii H88]|uniref:Serine/threonine-protein kinase ksp1 n=3 Tax=Ajellomyces capsulatus TaxID=5037 RepID=C0NR13_AJECG|nr:serine/threonine-protein kinase ksp1 [Histoplasma capsulatum G186AR]EGC48881.1 serine/threonine protein kinase ksp1 [Histoplasma capsulatum var. duboisii H88]KAG5293407.1 serine/threonine-protein kinase ksp1 [Histoplasma capsulatum]EEH06127.1 serine/threonine-protein kinase ksp1 [Histoplasma capsulatum G186AR]QSS54483.1 serine/threonine-protein kinase ksp1 [Histoplasma capsulatum var. duboisii H88]QSS74858.1 serine/threonine-protein kinase ksp1 [Histoplasma capsulatum G186AR]